MTAFTAKELIEQRASWKKYEEEHKIQEVELINQLNEVVPDAKKAVENIKKANPLKFELFKALLAAHEAKDQQEIEVVRQALVYADQTTQSITVKKKK